MKSDYSLGYLRFEVSDPAAWGHLLTNVIGLSTPETFGSTTGFRLDSYASRIQITEGPLDDVAAVGLVAHSRAAFDGAVERLKATGVAISEGSVEAAAERRVGRFVRFIDVDGAPVELALDQAKAAKPFVSPLVASGFDAEEMGIGHIVLFSNNLEESFRFYREIFGGRVSDTASKPVMGIEPLVGFMGLNKRHHSLAWLDRAPWPKRTVHFALEVGDRRDVGVAYDRTRDAGVPIVQELGVHPDGAFSFYGATPSGFPWEVGAEMMLLDDDWQPRQLDQFSLWGHRPVAQASKQTA